MTRTVAIIGLGSRGLGVLERIAALAGDEQVAVEVIDPSATGAGVHDPGQPDYLLLNTTCGQISMFPDRRSVGSRHRGAGAHPARVGRLPRPPPGRGRVHGRPGGPGAAAHGFPAQAPAR